MSLMVNINATIPEFTGMSINNVTHFVAERIKKTLCYVTITISSTAS